MNMQGLRAARDELLERIGSALQADPRFAAAWLGGSLGRGDGDAFSDIDLFVVVEDEACPLLCEWTHPVSGAAPASRMALFRGFGEPANIHENHHNAPREGSFSAVLYRQPPVMVDWSLLPRSLARRPAGTRLLFQRVPIPAGTMELNQVVEEPRLSLTEQRAERLAFFWMMAAIAAKYIARGAKAQPAAAWVLPFLAQAIAGLLERDPAALLPDGAPIVQLRSLCDVVESWQAEQAPARPIVEAILQISS